MNRLLFTQDSHDAPHGDAQLKDTLWSVVVSAGSGSAEALERLCRIYWYPLYAFVRRKGYSRHESEDLTQGFFAHLLETKAITKVAREKGRFRNFLLASFENFISNEWKKMVALKRGGDRKIVSWDELPPEERYRIEPQDGATPETLYIRSCAVALLNCAIEELRAEYVARGKSDLFECLHPYLQSDYPHGDGQKLAGKVGISPGAFRQALFRMREEHFEAVTRAIRNTLAYPTEQDIFDERSALIEVLTA